MMILNTDRVFVRALDSVHPFCADIVLDPAGDGLQLCQYPDAL